MGYGIKIMLLRVIVNRPVIVYVTGLREPLFSYKIFSQRHRTLVGSPFLKRFIPSAKFVHPFLRKELEYFDVAERYNRLHSTVLYLGSLQRGRGVETLLEAIKLSNRKKNVRLILAYNGYGHYTEEWLIDTVNRLGIESKVDIRGYVDAGDIYTVADILVIPRETRQFMSFPLRIIEALNWALPIIVTTMCDMHTLVEGAGISVEPAQPAAMADAILTLLDDHQLYKQCVEGCQTLSVVYASEHSLLAIREELLNAFSN
jgi:glycosyltransferase involved in cell wall biosynthesis